MTAGDLGTTPIEVEVALDRVFLCCGLWNAILLLDEADVFLRARTSGGLERNDLVSSWCTQGKWYKKNLLTVHSFSSQDGALPWHFILDYEQNDGY